VIRDPLVSAEHLAHTLVHTLDAVFLVIAGDDDRDLEVGHVRHNPS
jgi:hypothetical protein